LRTLCFLGVLPLLGLLSQGEDLDSRLATITESDCFARVEILAAPEMAGRATLSLGLDLAATYVEEELAALGLEPAGPDGAWRAPYPVTVLRAAEDTGFEWTPPKSEPVELKLGVHFQPIPGAPTLDKVVGEPLFVGWSIDARKEGWEDLKSKNVKGKIVFAFTREPRADDPKDKRFDGLDPTRHSTLRSKARAAEAAGAIALVLVPDPGAFPDPNAVIPQLIPVLIPGNVPIDQLLKAGGLPSLPIASVSREVASRIFDEDLDKFHASLEKRRKPKHLAAPKKGKVKTEISLWFDWERGKEEAFNLAARIPGKGDNPQTVVLGAHLDHVGYNHFWDKGRMRLHPGADDNASGSAALLEVAEALAGCEPEDDILFLWFSGEENGLLGSRAYCEEPLYPLESTVVMLNMDMVGRGDSKVANVGGLWDRPAWKMLLLKQARRIKSKLRLDLVQGRDLYGRSDQYSFHQKGVPGLFFFEADLDKNPVYHKPGDVPETMDGEKIARIARLFMATAWAVAVEGARP